ncbi:MAG: hypothetical protein QF744_15900 [SAR202 cluster bacterium]|jgi:hypothetical protein|nr:hypothetical protein [SAR202 cluster bacterium]MDP6801289.1 hypothetical protein [SAR202 cluster bacterium]|tara:strand:- start:120 stop:278 length:159 start_codon:yes stop_codon:yes gene_type:complete
MRESVGALVRIQFDRRLRPELDGATVRSDAGPLAWREPDDVLELTASATAVE